MGVAEERARGEFAVGVGRIGRFLNASPRFLLSSVPCRARFLARGENASKAAMVVVERCS